MSPDVRALDGSPQSERSRSASRSRQFLDEQSFRASTLVQDAVIRQIEIIGEAPRRVSPAFRQAHAEIPWTDMAGMRDKLIHDYFGVDVTQVWLTLDKSGQVLENHYYLG